MLLAEVSGYLVCLLMLIYVIESFLVFRYATAAHLRALSVRLSIWMFAVQGLLYAQIIGNTGNLAYLFFFLPQALLLFLFPLVFGRLFPDGSRILVNNMCMLLMVGMTMLLRIDSGKAIRQMVFVAVSLLLFLFVTEFVRRLRGTERYAYIFGGLGIAALLAVLLLGSETLGARISFTLFGFTFQPSEFVKLLYLLFIAGMLYAESSLPRVFVTAALCAAHVLILVLSKDLGSALILFVVCICMVYAATGEARYPLAGLCMGAAASVFAYRLFWHVRTRVQIWRDPWSTIRSQGYQITQSLFGISAGGPFGMGLFRGNPGSIPFVEDDMMFSAVAEEMGFLFASLMVLVCLSTFLNFLYEAYGMENRYHALIAVGVGVTYIFQVFLTVGGGTKFIPLTGVTLPLVSYGGSSLLQTMMGFALFEGVCLSDARLKAQEEAA